jgi:hypothetical protein
MMRGCKCIKNERERDVRSMIEVAALEGIACVLADHTNFLWTFEAWYDTTK